MDETIRTLPLGGQWETLGVDRLRGLWPESIEASSNEWGPDTLSFKIAAEAGARRPDLLPYTPIELELYGTLAWAGFVWQRPSAENAYTVSCRGWQYHLDDDLIDRAYVHTRLADYVDYRSLLSAELAFGTQAGTIGVDNGTISLGFAQASVIQAGTFVGVVLDAGPDSGFQRAVVSAEASFNNSRGQLYVMAHDDQNWRTGVGREDFVSAQGITSAPWSAAGQAQTFSGSSTNRHRYVTIMLYFNALDTGLGADTWIKIRSCQLYRSASYDVQSDGTHGPSSTLTADTVIGDVLAAKAPLLNQSGRLIQPGTFAIPSYETGGYVSPRSIMEAVNVVENYRLKIGGADLRSLVFDPKPTAAIAEVGDWSGSAFSDAAVAGDEIYDTAILDGTGPDGARLVSKRTQTGTLVDRRGFHRARRMDVSSAVTQAVADRINDLWLTEHRSAPFAGNLAIVGEGARRVLDGTPMPPHEFLLRSGDVIRFSNRTDPDTGAAARDGRIAGATYRHDDRAVEVAIDDQRTNFATILSRYAALVGG